VPFEINGELLGDLTFEPMRLRKFRGQGFKERPVFGNYRREQRKPARIIFA
jgi:hypothetical protein